MSLPYIDTDVLIRYVTGDDPQKQSRSAALLSQVEAGTLTLAAPVTVFADAVFVLSSKNLYHLPHSQVAAMLMPVVRLSHLKVKNRRALIEALDLYGSSALDFGDCMIIASMKQARSNVVYSYDRGFDRVIGITRREP